MAETDESDPAGPGPKKKKASKNRRGPEPFAIAGAGATFLTTILSAAGILNKLDAIQSDVALIKAERKVDVSERDTARREREDLDRRLKIVERSIDRLDLKDKERK